MDGGIFLNTTITSKDEILCVCRELIRKEGYKSINIRHVAKCCHISVGSVYNYFESKTDLIAETVANVWCDIFHFPDYRNTESDDPDESEIFQSFPDCVAWIFDRLKQGEEKYPGFFSLHSMGFIEEEKKDVQERMDRSWFHIRQSLVVVLKNDANIRSDAFDENFTEEDFAEIIFSLILASFVQHDFDARRIFNMIRKMLY